MGVFEYDADEVLAAIAEWNPATYFTEAACQKSLARHLAERFKKKAVVREHPIGRGYADIFIDFKDWSGFGAKVVVELKYDLQSLNEYHRLVGQIRDYIGIGEAEVIVVLCGATDPHLAALALQAMKDLMASKVIWKGAVVQKPFIARGASGRFISVRR